MFTDLLYSQKIECQGLFVATLNGCYHCSMWNSAGPFDVEKVAAAIEADAGESLPDLRRALLETTAAMERAAA
ncbi:MAG: hypothetical protein KGN37_07320 [Burkholderiales bacterium]|nr:hypothetical protein [Burkholderiales bacterium]